MRSLTALVGTLFQLLTEAMAYAYARSLILVDMVCFDSSSLLDSVDFENAGKFMFQIVTSSGRSHESLLCSRENVPRRACAFQSFRSDARTRLK